MFMVRVIMIVEMAGRPAGYLTERLEKHVGILRQIKDAEVYEIKVSEPRVIPREEGKEVAEGEEMFTAFAECDFELPSLSRMTETMFDFMPSSVEVIEPSSVDLDCVEATNLLNNISGRMHRYDEIAKIAGERMRQLIEQMQKMQKILIARDKEIAELKSGSVAGKHELGSDVAKKKAVKKTVKKKVAKKVNKKKK